jgi:hypothetical protein
MEETARTDSMGKYLLTFGFRFNPVNNTNIIIILIFAKYNYWFPCLVMGGVITTHFLFIILNKIIY